MKNNILLIIIFICIFQNLVLNKIEKMFFYTYLPNNFAKRPLKKCLNNNSFNCYGLPSGHAETISLFCFLLYFYNYIPIENCFLIIFVVSLQRVISEMHTIFQVIIGVILGFGYAYFYKINNFSFISFLIVFSVAFLLFVFHKVGMK